MTPERWHQVTDMFHAARAVAPESRRAFLAQACGEDAILRAAGFSGPERLLVPASGVGGERASVVRTGDDVVAWVYSHSGSAPHLFGPRLPTFDADLRRLLRAASPSGRFSESLPDTDVAIWRTPPD